jgi:hypothetical protein
MLKRQKEFLNGLKEQANASGGSRSGTHRVAFLAVRDLVEPALVAGYPMKSIWRRLSAEGRVSMNYATFRRHCRTLDLARRPAPEAARTAPNEDGPRRFVHSSVPRPRDKLV